MSDLLHPDDGIVELSPAEERARSFYDKTYAAKPEQAELPDSISELRSDPARRMFSGASMYGNDVKLGEAPVDATPEMKAAVETYNREVLEIYQDLEFNSDEAREVTELFQQHIAGPADAGTQVQWRAEADQALRRQYGDEAREALSLARTLVRRDPRVLHMLEVTGLGNHPQLVMKFAEKARSLHRRGKLRRS